MSANISKEASQLLERIREAGSHRVTWYQAELVKELHRAKLVRLEFKHRKGKTSEEYAFPT